MDKLIAYGGKDGIYYTMINENQYVVAKVKNEKVVKKKMFGSFGKVKEWAET
ncbi:hypothetical protein [Miniphocaeibacter massiliensis]|uniref:hypothetical protein n=1 Tax=Miniphocaeibacter massiliensis TaxID=2041841 RepID=UPI0013EDA7B9|nr:hypothetical protein [Miniphocaeibacter massiliensis]